MKVAWNMPKSWGFESLKNYDYKGLLKKVGDYVKDHAFKADNSDEEYANFVSGSVKVKELPKRPQGCKKRAHPMSVWEKALRAADAYSVSVDTVSCEVPEST